MALILMLPVNERGQQATYTRDRNILSGWFLAGNQGNHHNFDPSLLPKKTVFIKMKQKTFFFEKKFQNGQLKKTEFFKNTKNTFFACYCAYIGQPHGHKD